MAKRLARITQKVISPTLKKRGGQFSIVLAHWEEIVGQQLANICHPLSLKWNSVEIHPESSLNTHQRYQCQNAAILTIGCERFIALEIQHRNQEILRKVNMVLGDNFVTEIRTKAVAPSEHNIKKRYTDIERIKRIQEEKSAKENPVDKWKAPEDMNPRLQQAFRNWHKHL